MPHLLSETLVWCVTLLLFGMGLIGTLIPMLPGIIIIAAGCVWQGAMGRENLAWWEWTVLALLVAGGMVIDKLSGGMGAKKFGSTAAGIWGAIIGAVAGSLLFSPIVGLLCLPACCWNLPAACSSSPGSVPAVSCFNVKKNCNRTLRKPSAGTTEFLRC